MRRAPCDMRGRPPHMAEQVTDYVCGRVFEVASCRTSARIEG
jgi:hypothetical protein